MRRDTWLLQQLPQGMLGDDFFVRFVSIFQEQAGTLAAHADNLEHLADPTLTPPPMLRWLASWIGMEGMDSSLPEDWQRRLVAGSARLLAWRGTRRGLREFLELVSGGPARVEDSGGVWAEGRAPIGTARVIMRVASTGVLEEADFVALVMDEVPAHVHAELWVGSRRVWPVEQPAGARAREAALPGVAGQEEML